MARAEKVEADADGLVRRWDLDPRTASAVVALEQWATCQLAPCGLRWPGIFVVSGFRDSPVESELNPTAPVATRSLHMARRNGRPASLAVDLRVGNIPASATPLELFGFLATGWKLIVPGGRWGGEFNPPDVNHYDLGFGALEV